MLCPSMAAMRKWAARRPTSPRRISTVVSGGRAARAISAQLSVPTTAMSSGTETPAWVSASVTPRAMRSLPQ